MADPRFITVVSGLPRSGTSMMMRMLEAGGLPVLADHERSADADNPRGYYEFEPVKALSDDNSWLKEAQGRVVKVIYKLVYDLPPSHRYRVIFLERNLAEVLASQETMLARMGRGAGSLERDELMPLFEREIIDFRSWAKTQEHLDICYLNYSGVIAEPRATAHRIAGFLNLDLDVDAMAAAVDPALYRQRA